MKWGGRKISSSSSSEPSFISQTQKASQFSWLPKFMQMRINSEPNPAKIKHKENQNSTSSAGSSSSSHYSCRNGDRFYAGYDGVFRKQSCEEDSTDKRSKDFDDNVIASSSFHSGRSNAMRNGRREGAPKLKEKREEQRKLLNDQKVSKEMMDEYNRELEYEYLRRRFERKAQQVLQAQLLKLEREIKEVEFASGKEVEKDVLQFESPRTICTPRTHSFASSDSKNFRNILEDRVFSTQNFEKNDSTTQKRLSSEKQNLKVKIEKQTQPLHVSREVQRRKPKHSSKVRINSPRMASISKVESCKIKAIEDMRKAKLKVKKERKEIVEETPELDSFAVIKSSLDPKQDFRDSMIEMIMEKQISQPQEMEELLACYLTLNADEYHDLIIKVFRQVWFDMSQYGLGIKSEMQWCCYE